MLSKALEVSSKFAMSEAGSGTVERKLGCVKLMSTGAVILVVDDEESLCDLIAEILAEHYEVFKAFNGKEALEVVKKRHPSLVISDIMMPYMTGLELLKELRGKPETRHTPVILLSAAAPPPQEVVREAQAFVSKPFEIDALEALVAAIIKQSKPVQPQITLPFNAITATTLDAPGQP